jgi:hypothetical protein
MTGAQVIPPNASLATGTCTVSVDDVADTVTLNGTFIGLGTDATAAGIHGPAGPTSTAPVLLPATSVTAAVAGSFSGTASVTPLAIGALLADQAYCEVDDSAFPGGEIRGQFPSAAQTPALPPVAVAVLFFGLALAGATATRRVSRRVRMHEG